MLKRTLRTTTQRTTRAFYGTAAAGGGYDTDAQAYITLVEAADTESLETGVKDAINAFVVGCKSDGIWTAIKASCILAGARTLTGALVPLVGTAPTNNNFVSGDYSRTAGLTGDGSTKYLDSNRASNADPQNNSHISFYITGASVGFGLMGSRPNVSTGIGDTTLGMGTAATYPFRSRIIGFFAAGTKDTSASTGLIGMSRSLSSSYVTRSDGSNETISITSAAPGSFSHFVFSRNGEGSPSVYSACSGAFYSIGESLDLALLDTRVTTLITSIGTALA